jgi:hypothetical protein
MYKYSKRINTQKINKTPIFLSVEKTAKILHLGLHFAVYLGDKVVLLSVKCNQVRPEQAVSKQAEP